MRITVKVIVVRTLYILTIRLSLVKIHWPQKMIGKILQIS